MKNQARLNLIAELCAKRGQGPKLVAVVMPTKADTQEEIALNVAQDDKAPVVIDEDLPALSPSLSFDSAKEKKEKESESLLTASERKQLARELTEYRIKRDLSRVNPLALAIV